MLDADGQKAYQTVVVQVSATNLAPTLSYTPITSITAGKFYGLVVSATDADGDAITSYGISGPDGMTIDANGRLSWQTTPGTPTAGGTPVVYPVTITATDDHGHSTSSSFDLTVNPDNTAPRVKIVTTNQLPFAGDPMRITVLVSDNIAVVSRGLTVNGVAVPLTGSGGAGDGSYSFTPTTPGALTLQATASDAAGNTSTTELDLAVGNPLGTVLYTNGDVFIGPSGSITAPHEFDSSGNLTPLTGSVSVTGSVSGGSFYTAASDSTEAHTPSYILSYAPGDSKTYTTIATGSAAVSNGTLGTFDPTLLADGTYTLRLQVSSSGGTFITSRQVVVAGQLKLGNYNLAFNDLTVAISGLPITVSRSYDSLNASNNGSDFGYGWSLGLFGMNLQADVSTLGSRGSTDGLSGQGILPGFTAGTRVYVTMPDGSRQGFTFNPQPVPPPPGFDGAAGQFASSLLYNEVGLSVPSFIPDAGVTATLSVAPGLTLIRAADGSGDFTTADGIPFNPQSQLLEGYNEYTLTTTDGTSYSIDGPTGKVSIQDRQGNTLRFNSEGVQSIAPDGTVVAQVSFHRDYASRIDQITDPAGHTISYAYDGNGDLASVTDRDGNTTSYKYNQDSSGASIGRPHFLTDIIDPRGVDVAHATFDAGTGQFTGLIDASGHAAKIPVKYTVPTPAGGSTTALANKVIDALNNFTVLVYDARGNVVRKIQGTEMLASGSTDDSAIASMVTVFEFDAKNNQTAQSEPFQETGDDRFTVMPSDSDPTLWVSRASYDSRGDLLTSTDVSGNTTINTYDQYGDLLTTTDPSRNGTKNVYDDRGYLLSTTDTQGQATRYTYDPNGNLLTTTDAFGNVSTNTYKSTGQLETTTDPNGVTHTYGYNGAGNQVSDSYLWSSGGASQTLTTTTSYDASGRALSTTDTQNNTASRTYTSNGQVATLTDVRGHVSTNTYDARGLLIQTQTETRNADGSAAYLLTRTVYDDNGRPVLTTDSYPQGSADPIFATATTYDSLGRVVETHRIKGVIVDITGTSPSQESSIDASHPGTTIDHSSTSTSYDALGRAIRATDGFGNVSKTTYDEAGNEVQTAKESQDQYAIDHDKAAWVVTRTVYDDQGRATFTTNPFIAYSSSLTDSTLTAATGVSITGTESVYDSLGRQIQSRWLDGLTIDLATNGDGTAGTSATAGYTLVSASQTVYNSLGQTVQTIGPYAPTSSIVNAPTTGYEYDSQGRQVAVIYPAALDAATGTMVRQRVETVYGAFDGQQSQTISNILQAVPGGSLPTGSGTHVQTLANGDVVDYSGQHVTSYAYDPFGNLTQTTVSGPDGSGGTMSFATSTTYDSHNRKTSETDALGNVTSYGYDSMGRLASVTMPAVPDPSHGGTLTHPVYTYAYDALGNQVLMTDALSRATTYTYDQQGHQLTQTLPMSQVQTSTYDDLGRPATTTALNGVVTIYAYDDTETGDGRLSGVTYYANATDHATGSSAAAATTTYTYDALGRIIGTVDVTSSRDPGSTVGTRTSTNTFDKWGNLIQVDSPEGTIGYEYDPVTGMHTRTWTGSSSSPVTEQRYTYDDLGRLAQVELDVVNSTDLATLSTNSVQDTDYTYNLDGTLAAEVQKTGGSTVTTSAYTYNGLDQLTELKETNAGGTILADYVYTLRPDGSRSGATETILQGNGHDDVTTITWTYDAESRLTGESESSTDSTTAAIDYATGQNYSDTFTYGLTGNRHQDVHTAPSGASGVSGISGNHSETTTYTYNANDELTVQASSLSGETDFSYDAAGNQTGSTDGSNTTTYVYNTHNKMSQTTLNGVVTRYLYDDTGNRDQEIADGTTTVYLTDTNNPTGYVQPIEEKTSAAASPTLSYILGRRVIGQTNFTSGSPTASTFLTDGHGSTRLLIHGTGVDAQFHYSAFGNALNFDSATASIIFLFAGDGIYDPASGFYFHGIGRVTEHGRFVQINPPGYADIQNPVSLAPYTYTNNNPIDNIDPTGLFTAPQGYAAEMYIYSVYLIDHPTHNVAPGGSRTGLGPIWGPAYWLKPDILNRTTKKWIEIKPLSVSGLAKAVTQYGLYLSTLSPYGYRPDDSWSPSQHYFYTGGSMLCFFNTGGVVFYTDILDNLEDLAALSTIQAVRAWYTSYMARNALKFALERAGWLAGSGNAADEARLYDSWAIAGLLALIGF